MLNQTWFLSYLIVPLWYNNVNWDNDNTKYKYEKHEEDAFRNVFGADYRLRA